jgi:hypothetical protein
MKLFNQRMTYPDSFQPNTKVISFQSVQENGDFAHLS